MFSLYEMICQHDKGFPAFSSPLSLPELKKMANIGTAVTVRALCNH